MKVTEWRITSGYYGRDEKFPCDIFVYENFYAIKGGRRIWEVTDPRGLICGVDLETVADIGMSDTKTPIESIKDLKAFIAGGDL